MIPRALLTSRKVVQRKCIDLENENHFRSTDPGWIVPRGRWDG